MDTYCGNAYDPASLHRYTYAQNNPQMYTDPSGHFIGFISFAVNTFCTEVVRNFDYLNVVGMFSGTMACMLAQILEYEGDYNTLFVTSYLTGAGYVGAYMAACAIAVMLEVEMAFHLVVCAYMTKEYRANVVTAIVCGVTGNKKAMAVYASVAVLCLFGALMELHLAGTIYASGPKGMAAFEVNGESGTSAKGLIGHDFEGYLSKTIGGDGSFSVGGRDFDGGIGNRWWEAKSGNYWSMLEENPNKLAKFKSDMGNRLRIATENGATYEIFSNTPIPESIKQWLTKKGITFTELLD